MRRPRHTLVAVTSLLILAACGTDPASGVAVPGAPAGGTLPPTVPTTAPAPTTTVAPAPTTSAAPETTAAPATTAPPPTTAAPATSVVATTTAPPPTTEPPPTTGPAYEPEPASGGLRPFVEGPRSLQLQRDLILLGHLPPGADDGQYGPGTAGGVRRFQDAEGLIVDGVAGPVTLDAIAQAVAAAIAPTTTVV